MFNKIKNWNKLVKFIKLHREKKAGSFKLLTTGSEIIIYPEPKNPNTKEEERQIRFNYR